MSTLDRLKDPSLLIVFLFAPMGLGHLRVTKALYEGLPGEIPHIMLGAGDMAGTLFHRFISSYPLAKTIMEHMQYGAGEKIATVIYRYFMQRASPKLLDDLAILLKQQVTVPKTVLVVATHPGLAHEFAAIKKQFAKEQGVRAFLVVQVTDDSPQQPWDVPGADIIFSPSDQTSQTLAHYHRHEHSPSTKFVTTAYPIAPVFALPLPREQYQVRLHQVDPHRDTTIHIAIPVSGAAVGLTFHKIFMHTLSELSPRCTFHIVAKKAPFTESFLTHVNRHENMRTYVSTHDREVVTLYEAVYASETIALEVTKPSEQAFKALTDPKKRGGSLLLFADPVGRQEYDNLNFLEQRHLIPTREQMYDICSTTPKETTIDAARQWRGVILPKDPKEAAHFTFSCLQQGIFTNMMKYEPPKETSHHYTEVNPYGVFSFWKTISYLLAE